MADIFRDTAVGVVIRFLTKNKHLQYPEERPDFQIPDVWQRLLNGEAVSEDSDDVSIEKKSNFNGAASMSSPRGSASADEENQQTSESDELPYALHRSSTSLHHTRSREETMPYTEERMMVDEMHEIERTRSLPIVPRRTRTQTQKPGGSNQDTTAIVVDWYTSDDPANPQNWSSTRRWGITALIGIYTFVVYTSSAIYTNSEEGIMEAFGVSTTQAALGLALFVLGYGTGPLIFSPLSEIPAIGRNPIYAVTMILYVVVSLPTALAYGNHGNGPGGSSGTFSGLLALRFLQGFFGSPCLASGAASLGDMFSALTIPFALTGWVSAAYCGPAFGPLLSGYSVPAKGWRWSLLEILWAAAPICVVMLLLLPETSADNILLRRARRLRAATGSDRFVAPSEAREREKDAADVAAGRPTRSPAARTWAVLFDALIKPAEITIKDPAVLFVQVYTAIVYCIYYSFFEVFPLVFPERYGMSAGQMGLVFLCILVACAIGITIYLSYIGFYLNPRVRATGHFPVAEQRLIPALIASFGPTIGLFIFAWTAENAPRVPWIAPTIGITIYGASAFVIVQCIFVYVPLSYPQYAASLFAANDFCRSAMAFGSVLYGRPLYMNLGIGRGTSLLGGLSTIGIFGIWLLYFYGARLRALSKFAVKS